MRVPSLRFEGLRDPGRPAALNGVAASALSSLPATDSAIGSVRARIVPESATQTPNPGVVDRVPLGCAVGKTYNSVRPTHRVCIRSRFLQLKDC